MARCLGLGLVAMCALGCGDNIPPPAPGLIRELSAERVAAPAASAVLDVAIAALDERSFAIGRVTSRGDDFCPECLGQPPSECAAICRRAVIEVSVQDARGAAGPTRRVAEVLPATALHRVDAIDLVALDRTHLGVAWLDCDDAPCAPGRPRQRCAASYATLDLGTGAVGPTRTLYTDRHGDLQLAFDPRGHRLLALVGAQRPSSVGVHAAIYDPTGAEQLAPWRSYGGAGARAPAAVATTGGFVIAAEDPAPALAPPAEPCAESCDCQAAPPPDLAVGGLYAFRAGRDAPPERLAPGRGRDSTYGPRESIALIDTGGRALAASCQSGDRFAELFEPAIGGWLRRHASQAPSPSWIGALGDGDHLAWVGAEPTGDEGAEQRLVAGVVTDDAEERGQIATLGPGVVLDAAPVVTEAGVARAFVLRGVPAPGAPGGSSPWAQLEVLEIRADW